MPTKEDVDAVREALDEVNQERSGGQEDTTNQPDQHAEDDANDVDRVADSESVEEGGITDDLRSRAQDYGLNPDLFENAEQLEQQMLSLDQRFAREASNWRNQQQQQYQQPYAQPQASPQHQQHQQQDTLPEVPFQLDLDPEEYPDGLVEKFNGVLKQIHESYSPLRDQVKQLQDHITYQQQQYQQQEQMRVIEEFEDAVTTLGHKQLFGEKGSANATQSNNLQRLFAEADALAAGYQMRGMQVPPMKELVRRAEQLAFANELKDYHARTANARLQKQAGQKLGSGRRAPIHEGDWDGEPEENPVLKAKWNELMQEVGER